MKRLFNPNSTTGIRDLMLLIVRVGIPLMLIASHGYPKLLKLISGDQIQFMNIFGMGQSASFILVTFSEFFCSCLVILGLFTRGAALVIVLQFLVLVFHVHIQDPLAVRELPTLYLISFVAILFMGPGKYSLDNLLHRRFSSLRPATA